MIYRRADRPLGSAFFRGIFQHYKYHPPQSVECHGQRWLRAIETIIRKCAIYFLGGRMGVNYTTGPRRRQSRKGLRNNYPVRPVCARGLLIAGWQDE
jgi:hypothetical protein